MTMRALQRLGILALAWAAGGFLSCGQMAVLMKMMPSIRRTAIIHMACHALGVVLLFAGGFVVRDGGGGYIPCKGNVTMDFPCMLTQGSSYLWPYVLHFVGGSYFIAAWLLDGCHLLSWAQQVEAFHLGAHHQMDQGNAPTQKMPADSESLAVFLSTPSTKDDLVTVSFDSRWHLFAKIGTTLILITTWTSGAVYWSTDPDLSWNVYPEKTFVSLGGLLLIFAVEALVVFMVVSLALRWLGSSCRNR